MKILQNKRVFIFFDRKTLSGCYFPQSIQSFMFIVPIHSSIFIFITHYIHQSFIINHQRSSIRGIPGYHLKSGKFSVKCGRMWDFIGLECGKCGVAQKNFIIAKMHSYGKKMDYFSF